MSYVQYVSSIRSKVSCSGGVVLTDPSLVFCYARLDVNCSGVCFWQWVWKHNINTAVVVIPGIPLSHTRTIVQRSKPSLLIAYPWTRRKFTNALGENLCRSFCPRISIRLGAIHKSFGTTMFTNVLGIICHIFCPRKHNKIASNKSFGTFFAKCHNYKWHFEWHCVEAPLWVQYPSITPTVCFLAVIDDCDRGEERPNVNRDVMSLSPVFLA